MPKVVWIVAELTTAKGASCRQLLESLPSWFGLPAAIDDYASDVEQLQTFAATHGTALVGLLALKRHSDVAEGIHVMAVAEDQHRRGIGRALLERATRECVARGCKYLTVKTLSSAHPDAFYARTRAFYRAMGFETLQELPTLWDEHNPAVLLVKRLV